MNTEVYEAVLEFIKRAEEKGINGSVVNKDDILNLNSKLNGLLPQWYSELLATVPICGIEFELQVFEPEDDFDGLQSIELNDSNGICIESLEYYPGLEIFKKGYICIASDSTGGGDPYFININEGDNPPVYRVYHDISDNADEILEKGRELVSNSLSELFKSAIFQ